MKFEVDKSKIIVYLYNKDKLNMDEVFNNLKDYFDINSHNNLKIYKNEYYGIILEIYFRKNDRVEVLNNSLFLYEIKDPLDYINEEVYFYKNKYYLNIKKNDISIMEKSNIIYSNDVYKIIGQGIKL